MTMVYVDLNPVRAGVVDRPEAARHTSLRQRLEQRKSKVDCFVRSASAWLLPIEKIFPDGRMNMALMTFNHYLKLVDVIGRRKGRKPRRKAIAPELRPRTAHKRPLQVPFALLNLDLWLPLAPKSHPCGETP